MDTYKLLNGMLINTKEHLLWIEEALDEMYGTDRTCGIDNLSHEKIQLAIDFWCINS